ncbi:MAG: HAMP domain-containing histidine kinase [Peptococcaceae bacterium]|nr:HAMP domain-containing histidine kinase [Peptococcaceae bacterium]
MRGSFYLRLVGMLITILFVSNLIVFAVFVLTTERGVLTEADETLVSVVSHLKSLHAEGALSANQLPALLRTGYFRATIYANIGELRENRLVYKYFTAADFALLREVDEIQSRTLRRGHFIMPAAIVRLSKNGTAQYLFVAPDLSKLMFNFRSIIAAVNMTSLVIGSVMILFAANYLVNPIKKLSLATKEISKGNFNVAINEVRRDEMGKLIAGFNFMAKELQKIEMLRSDFITAISHEFKTPLSAIKGYAQLLGESEDETERKECAAFIAEEAERLAHLASNILLINRLENETEALERQTFRLDEQLRKAVLLLEGQWVAKELEMEVDLAEVIYFGNEQLLYQVWINVLDNAIKFSHARGRLEIALTQDQGITICTIRDYGVGLAPENQNRVFEKFYQADKSRGTAGNGLGLAIVKRIIEMHHGEVTLSGMLGQGTSVEVVLR